MHVQQPPCVSPRTLRLTATDEQVPTCSQCVMAMFRERAFLGAGGGGGGGGGLGGGSGMLSCWRTTMPRERSQAVPNSQSVSQ